MSSCVSCLLAWIKIEFPVQQWLWFSMRLNMRSKYSLDWISLHDIDEMTCYLSHCYLPTWYRWDDLLSVPLLSLTTVYLQVSPSPYFQFDWILSTFFWVFYTFLWIIKESRLSHQLQFFSRNMFTTWWCKPLISKNRLSDLTGFKVWIAKGLRHRVAKI